LRIAHHGHANALEKSVIPSFAKRDGLVAHIPGRFWNTGQERLCQYVYEREQCLLSYPQITDFSGHTIQTRSDPLFRRIDAAFAASQLPLDRCAHERAVLENPPFFVAASIRLLSSALYRRPWVTAFCFRTIAMGAYSVGAGMAGM